MFLLHLIIFRVRLNSEYSFTVIFPLPGGSRCFMCLFHTPRNPYLGGEQKVELIIHAHNGAVVCGLDPQTWSHVRNTWVDIVADKSLILKVNCPNCKAILDAEDQSPK